MTSLAVYEMMRLVVLFFQVILEVLWNEPSHPDPQLQKYSVPPGKKATLPAEIGKV